jgi:hypothetical protein
MVQKRNGVLLNVWEKYWQIIPESEKASEEAMRMWLALATQVRAPNTYEPSWLISDRHSLPILQD